MPDRIDDRGELRSLHLPRGLPPATETRDSARAGSGSAAPVPDPPAADESRERWDLADYLLMGQGPSERVVQAEFLEAVGAGTSAVMVPLNDETLYGSLLMLTAGGKVLKARLGQLLRDQRVLTNWTRDLRSRLDECDRVAVERLLNPLFVDVDLGWIGHASIAQQRAPRRGPDLQLFVLRDTESPPLPGAVRRLAAVLATTIPVVARTADRENAFVERAVRGLEGKRSQDQSDLLGRLITLALDATRSDWGAIYTPSGPKRLQRLAAANLPDDAALEYLDLLASTQLGARAYRQNRTFLLTQSSLNVEPLSGSPPGPQLAVPIGGAERKQSFLSGILVLGRNDWTAAVPYSQYDAALARNVAIRLSIQSEAQFLAETLGLFSELQQRPMPHFDAELDAHLGDSARIGNDLALLAPSFLAIVQQLADHPQVDSASVRVLSIDRTELVRLAIAPAEREHDSDARISVSNKSSVVAHTARTSEVVYLPNLDKVDDIKRQGLQGVVVPKQGHTSELRPTKCELCVPIKLGNRTVGTLNVESSRKNSLESLIPIATILANLSAAQVQRLHRRLERQILDYGTRLFGAAHTLAGISDQLKSTVQFTPADLYGFAETITRSLSLAGEVRETDTVFHPVNGLVAVAPLLDAAFRAVDADVQGTTARRIHWETERPEPDLAVAEEVAPAIYLALTELLRNGFARAPKDSTGSKQVDMACGRYDAALWIDVQNHFPRGTRVPASALFAVPVAAGGRVHVGALGAAVATRGVGGDLYIADLGETHVRVRLTAPTTLREGQ